MKKIVLTPLSHKNEQQIAVGFPYDLEIKNHLQKLGFIKWSRTHKTFYAPFSTKNQQVLYQHLRKKGWFVDYSALSKTKPVQGGGSAPKEKSPTGLSGDCQKLISDFHDWMLQQRYSKNTVSTYCGNLRVFFGFYRDKDVGEITEADVVRFNQEHILANDYSRSFQNQTINAIKLFYKRMGKTKLDLENLERPRKETKLPVVLSLDEVSRLLSGVKNQKHRCLLSFVYSCGLRIGEALSVRFADIDSNRGFLHIKGGKGAKDRYVPLSDKTLSMLREYYKAYRPKEFMFEGQNGGQYSQGSARKIIKEALKKAKITKQITLHGLRHSFATHLLENGTDTRYIQNILGHKSPKTTMIYTHISSGSLKKIKNPFDDL